MEFTSSLSGHPVASLGATAKSVAQVHSLHDMQLSWPPCSRTSRSRGTE